jgi:amidohydrolase
MREKVLEIIEGIKDELIQLSEYIYRNPELGYEEFKSSRAHIDLLKKHNFHVIEGYLGMETAFRAEYKGEKEGPTIAYLAEYDALPEIGHGCGHNLLGTVSTGAGIVLSKFIDQIGGRVVVFGTPAEETSGAKVIMVDKGAFDDVDVAMMAHPDAEFYQSGSSLALEAIQFTFRGKTAHAASSPEKGINALDAVIQTFNSINALRQHILPTARIHGVIIEGGKAANVIPDLAIAQFYVRATTKKYLKELSEKVKNCARGASLATGAQLEITNYEASYDNMVTNETLSKRYNEHLKSLGVEDCEKVRKTSGSLDMGNVSHVCPAIHPYFGIARGSGIAPHTRELAAATLTDEAHDSMVKTIGALVLTGIDVIVDKEFLKNIKDEFNSNQDK